MPTAVTVTKGVRGDFGWMFRLLSALLSGLAIVALARHAFVTWSLSAPMALIMDAYNAVMQLLFGWAQPYLQAALTWLGSFIGWQPTLYAHWKDVFVVTALLAVGSNRASKHNLRDNEQNGDSFTSGALGVCAIVSACFAGVLPLASDDLTIQIVIAASFWIVVAIPVVLIATLIAASEADTSAFYLVPFALFPVVIATVITWWLSRFFGSATGLGIAGLAASIILVVPILSLFSLHEGRRWPFVRTILGGFVGVPAFFAIDAGLKLLLG